MTLWRRQDCGDSKKISCCQGLESGEGEENKQIKEDFKGPKLYESVALPDIKDELTDIKKRTTERLWKQNYHT